MTPDPVDLGFTNGKAEHTNGNGGTTRQNRIVCEEVNGSRDNVEINGVCPCADANGSDVNVTAKSTKGSSHVEFMASAHRESTMKDLCNNVDDWEDDEDDGDWEPLLERLAIKRWFCTNCTMFNLDGMESCESCNEHKESGILRHGFFASAVSPGADLTHAESEVIEGYTKSFSDISAAGCSTAVGYDERMLLHSEVPMFTASGLHVRFLKVWEKSGYNTVEWVRYITKAGSYEVRPPGHHAGVHQAMGFCLHNNAVIAALAAQAAGAKKVLILDWDVHHGNGTQEIFEKNKSVLYISSYRHEGGKFYPGTGAAHEVGTMGAEGYCVNVPWSRGKVGDNDDIFAFQHAVMPIALEFDPDFTIISAGFDAARGDPLGGCDVTPAGYACMTHLLSTLAKGKLLEILEGGYNLRSISSSATAVIKVLLGETIDNKFDGVEPSAWDMQALLDVLKIQKNFWPCLNSNLTKLQACWESYLLGKNRKAKKKGVQVLIPPIWWKLGRKRFMYYLHCRRLRMKMKPE